MNRVPKSLRRFSIDPFEFISGRLHGVEEIGAYVLILCFMWGDGAKAPGWPYHDAESMARLCGLSVLRWNKISRRVLAEFELKDGVLRSPRLTEQWVGRMESLARAVIDLPLNARPGSRESKYRNRSRVQVRGERRAALLARDENACVWCKRTESLCLDHIIPVSLGGDDSDDNYQVLCSSCNSRKGSAEARP